MNLGKQSQENYKLENLFQENYLNFSKGTFFQL